MFIKLIFIIFVKYNFILFKKSNFFWKKKISLQLFFFSKTFANKIFIGKKYYYNFVKMKNLFSILVNPRILRRSYKTKKLILEARSSKSPFVSFKRKIKAKSLRHVWGKLNFYKKSKYFARITRVKYRSDKGPKRQYYIGKGGYRRGTKQYIYKRRKYYFAHKKYAPHLLTLGEVVWDKLVKTVWESPEYEKVAKNYFYFLIKRKRRMFSYEDAKRQVKRFRKTRLRLVRDRELDKKNLVMSRYLSVTSAFKWAVSRQVFIKKFYRIDDFIRFKKLEIKMKQFNKKFTGVKYQFSRKAKNSVYKNMIKFYLKTSNSYINFFNHKKFVKNFKQSFIVKKVYRTKQHFDLKTLKISNLYDKVLFNSFKKSFKSPKNFFINKSWNMTKNKKHFYTILSSISKKLLKKRLRRNIYNFRRIYVRPTHSGAGFIRRRLHIDRDGREPYYVFKRIQPSRYLNITKAMRFRENLRHKLFYDEPLEFEEIRDFWESRANKRSGFDKSYSFNDLYDTPRVIKNRSFSKLLNGYNRGNFNLYSTPSVVKNTLNINAAFESSLRNELKPIPGSLYSRKPSLYQYLSRKKFFFKSKRSKKKKASFLIKKISRSPRISFWKRGSSLMKNTSFKLFCFFTDQLSFRPRKVFKPNFFSFFKYRKFLSDNLIRFKKFLNLDNVKKQPTSLLSFSNKFLIYKDQPKFVRFRREKLKRRIKNMLGIKSTVNFSNDYHNSKFPGISIKIKVKKKLSKKKIPLKKLSLKKFFTTKLIKFASFKIDNRRSKKFNNYEKKLLLRSYKRYWSKEWWQRKWITWKKPWTKIGYFNTRYRRKLVNQDFAQIRWTYPRVRYFLRWVKFWKPFHGRTSVRKYKLDFKKIPAIHRRKMFSITFRRINSLNKMFVVKKLRKILRPDLPNKFYKRRMIKTVRVSKFKTKKKLTDISNRFKFDIKKKFDARRKQLRFKIFSKLNSIYRVAAHQKKKKLKIYPGYDPRKKKKISFKKIYPAYFWFRRRRDWFVTYNKFGPMEPFKNLFPDIYKKTTIIDKTNKWYNFKYKDFDSSIKFDPMRITQQTFRDPNFSPKLGLEMIKNPSKFNVEKSFVGPKFDTNKILYKSPSNNQSFSEKEIFKNYNFIDHSAEKKFSYLTMQPKKKSKLSDLSRIRNKFNKPRKKRVASIFKQESDDDSDEIDYSYKLPEVEYDKYSNYCRITGRTIRHIKIRKLYMEIQYGLDALKSALAYQRKVKYDRLFIEMGRPNLVLNDPDFRKKKLFKNSAKKIRNKFPKNDIFFKNYFKNYSSKIFVKNLSNKSGKINFVYLKSSSKKRELSWKARHNWYYKLSKINNLHKNIRPFFKSDLKIKTINFFLKNQNTVKLFFNKANFKNKNRLFKNYFKTKNILETRNSVVPAVSNKIDLLQISNIHEELVLGYKRYAYFNKVGLNIKPFVFNYYIGTVFPRKTFTFKKLASLSGSFNKFVKIRNWRTFYNNKFNLLRSTVSKDISFKFKYDNYFTKRYNFFKTTKKANKFYNSLKESALKQKALLFPKKFKIKEKYIPNYLNVEMNDIYHYDAVNKYNSRPKIWFPSNIVFNQRPIFKAKLRHYLRVKELLYPSLKQIYTESNLPSNIKVIKAGKRKFTKSKILDCMLKKKLFTREDFLEPLDLFFNMKSFNIMFSGKLNSINKKLKNLYFEKTFNNIYRFRFKSDDLQDDVATYYFPFQSKTNRKAYKNVRAFRYIKYNSRDFQMGYYNSHPIRRVRALRKKYSKKKIMRKVKTRYSNHFFSSRRAHQKFFKLYNINPREGFFRNVFFNMFKSNSKKKSSALKSYTRAFNHFRNVQSYPNFYVPKINHFSKNYIFNLRKKIKTRSYVNDKASFIKNLKTRIFYKKQNIGQSWINSHLFALENRKFLRLNKYKNRIFYHIFNKSSKIILRKTPFSKKRQKRPWFIGLVTRRKSLYKRKKGMRKKRRFPSTVIPEKLAYIKFRAFKAFKKGNYIWVGKIDRRKWHSRYLKNYIKTAKSIKLGGFDHWLKTVEDEHHKLSLVNKSLTVFKFLKEEEDHIVDYWNRVDDYLDSRDHYTHNFFTKNKYSKSFRERLTTFKSVYKNSVIIFSNFRKILNKNKYFRKRVNLLKNDLFFVKIVPTDSIRIQKNYIWEMICHHKYSSRLYFGIVPKSSLKAIKKCILKLFIWLNKAKTFLLKNLKRVHKAKFSVAVKKYHFDRYHRVILKRTKWVYFIGLFDYKNNMIVHFDYLSLNIRFSKKTRINFYIIWNRMIFRFYVELLKRGIFNITELYYYKRNRRKNKIKLSWVKMFVRHHIKAFRCKIFEDKIFRINKFSFSKKTTKNKKMKR